MFLPTSAITNFTGFTSAMRDVFTVYGGHVNADGTASLSGFGLALGDACAILFIVCLLTSGVTWIMGSDRALAVSCYDGAGPRFLGVISAKYGTPVRVNVFSGIVASIVVVLGNILTSGNASKYFGAVLGVTISTTLISYLLIYPALWKLRISHPGTPRPFRGRPRRGHRGAGVATQRCLVAAGPGRDLPAGLPAWIGMPW
jgi:amino acid transporter